MLRCMKKKIRDYLWKLLGYSHYKYLIKQSNNFLDQITDGEIRIGTGTYNNSARIWKWGSKSSLIIGKYCSIANDVHFILDAGHHDFLKITNYPLVNRLFSKEELITLNGITCKQQEHFLDYPKEKTAINIGNDVWIGAGVKILPGVSIGDCSTVLAGAVVTKSFPAFSVIGGVPAELFKTKLEPLKQERFLSIAWWNWDVVKIKKFIDDFNLSYDDFILKHYDRIN